MTLSPWTFPDGTELLVTWLSPLAETRTERPAGAPLPMIVVRDLGGPATDLVSTPLFSVEVFAVSAAAAQSLSSRVHRRINLLCGHQSVDISTGKTYVDRVNVIEEPHPVYYAQGVERWVGAYQLTLRIIAG